MKNLVRLIYTSRMSDDFGPADMDRILDRGRDTNPLLYITSLLAVCSDRFVQVIEGPRDRVCALYHRIAVDPRHREVMLIRFEEADARRFEDWSLGFITVDHQLSRSLLKYSADGTLEPDSLTTDGVIELMTELACELRSRRYEGGETLQLVA